MKSFSALFLVLVALLAVALAASPMTLLQDDPDDKKPIVVNMDAITVDSDTVRISGDLDIVLFANQWRVDFEMHIAGATIIEAVLTRTTMRRFTDPVRSVEVQNRVVVNGDRLVVSGLNWPNLSDADRRLFNIKLRVKNVSPKGVSLLGSSFVSADQGKIMQSFKAHHGVIYESMGKLVTAFKPKKQKSPFDPILSDVDFTLKNVNIPSDLTTARGIHFYDQLFNVKYFGPSPTICTVNGKKAEVDITPQFLNFKDIELWKGAKTVKVTCPASLQVSFSITEKDHIWGAGVTVAGKTYLAQQSEVDWLHPEPPNRLLVILIILVAIAIVLGVVTLALKCAKIGPFKQSIEDRYSVNVLPNEEAYNNMA